MKTSGQEEIKIVFTAERITNEDFYVTKIKLNTDSTYLSSQDKCCSNSQNTCTMKMKPILCFYKPMVQFNIIPTQKLSKDFPIWFIRQINTSQLVSHQKAVSIMTENSLSSLNSKYTLWCDTHSVSEQNLKYNFLMRKVRKLFNITVLLLSGPGSAISS
jgi:hypothetical protein